LSLEAAVAARRFYDGLRDGAMQFELIHPEIVWRTPASLPWTPPGEPEREG
jgi:hypothetical protein